jgi:hypothetical protein
VQSNLLELGLGTPGGLTISPNYKVESLGLTYAPVEMWCNYSFSINMWCEKSIQPVHPATNGNLEFFLGANFHWPFLIHQLWFRCWDFCAHTSEPKA